MISWDEINHRGGITKRAKAQQETPIPCKQRARRRQRLTRAEYIGHIYQRPAKKGRYKELTRRVFLNPLKTYEQPDWVHRAEAERRRRREALYGSNA